MNADEESEDEFAGRIRVFQMVVFGAMYAMMLVGACMLVRLLK